MRFWLDRKNSNRHFEMPENYIVRHPSFGKCLFGCSAKVEKDTAHKYKRMGRNPQYMRCHVCRSKQVIKRTVTLLRKKSEDISNVRYCFRCWRSSKKGVLKALRKKSDDNKGGPRIFTGWRPLIPRTCLAECMFSQMAAREGRKKSYSLS